MQQGAARLLGSRHLVLGDHNLDLVFQILNVSAIGKCGTGARLHLLQAAGLLRGRSHGETRCQEGGETP